MIFTVLGLVIFIYGLKSFRKALIIYVAFKLVLVTNITLVSLPGIPMLTVETLMDILFFVLYLYKKKSIVKAKITIPWQTPFIFISIALLLSCFFALAGITSEISAYIKFLLENVLFIWILWDTLEDEQDYIFAFKLITVVILLSCIYGLFEYAIQINPLQLYEETLNHDPTKLATYTYSIAERGYRINSVFEHAIGAGMNWGIYACFVLNKFLENDRKIPFRYLSYFTAVLCIICLLLTKMRSPIIFFMIAAIGAFNLKKKRTYAYILLGIFIVAIIMPSLLNSLGDVSNVFKSIFDPSYQTLVGGSDKNMRLNQFEGAFNVMKGSPVFGLGYRYKGYLSYAEVRPLLGSESIWLKVIPSYGIVGLISYYVFLTYSIVKIPKYFKSRQLFFIMVAFWTTYSITSITGFKVHLLFIFAFYFIKKSHNYSSLMSGDRKTEVNLKQMKVRNIYRW